MRRGEERIQEDGRELLGARSVQADFFIISHGSAV